MKGAKNITEAKKIIAELKLDRYFNLVAFEGCVSFERRQENLNQYRQFLLLHWCAHYFERDRLLAPSESALAIWYNHREDGIGYANFCIELVGRMIHLEPCLIQHERHGRKAKENSVFIQKYHCGDTSFSDYYINER